MRSVVLKLDTMPNPILGDAIGDAPNSGTGNNHDDANVIIPNSGLNNIVPNSWSDILNTSNSSSNNLTMPLSRIATLTTNTN